MTGDSMETSDAQASKRRHSQQIILRRILWSGLSHLVTIALAATYWWLGYIETGILLNYIAILIVINGCASAAVLTGFNLRFSDPGMTGAQIYLSSAGVLYVMYYAQQARGVFLLLGVTAMMYGLFQLSTRTFLRLSVAVLASYATLIWLLHVNRPAEMNLQVEILQLFAFGACLIQFSILGGFITRLRTRVRDNNRELESRNRQLETAFARIEELAMRDELTGVFNRRHLMDVIRLEKQRADRSGSVFSICIFDVDFFKKINDQYGHQIGDQVLQQIAATAARIVRETDHFGRYGGEEFACVLTDTSAAGAAVTAERIRAGIAALRFPEITEDLRVTVSIGIAECVPTQNTSETFKRADDALYQAKHNGRNQCVVAASEHSLMPELSPP